MQHVFLSIKEAAKYANVTTGTIRHHIKKSGKLSAQKVEQKDRWDPAWYVTKESVDNLYYKTREGEKQHTVKNSFEVLAEKHPNVVRVIGKHPEICESLASRATTDGIEAAIALLKARGYKVLKPVTSHEEV